MFSQGRSGWRIFAGIVLLLAGLAMLLDNTGILPIGPLWRFWPGILIAAAVVRLGPARTRREQGAAIWLLLLGIWCALWTFGVGGLTIGDLWPALFIALGVSMLWKTLPGPGNTSEGKEAVHGT